jgi:hypothetical protein
MNEETNLLASGTQQDGMFELSDVRALHVHEGRVSVDHSSLHEVLEPHQVLRLAEPNVVRRVSD